MKDPRDQIDSSKRVVFLEGQLGIVAHDEGGRRQGQIFKAIRAGGKARRYFLSAAVF